MTLNCSDDFALDGVKLEWRYKVMPGLRKMNLQFFAEAHNEGSNAESSDATLNTGNNGVENTNTSAGQQSGEQKGQFIPKARFDEVNQKFKDVQKQLDELLAAKNAAEKAEAEKRGEFEKLYQETAKQAESLKEQATNKDTRVQQLEGVISQLLEQRLSNVPEEMRDLIPSDYSVEQKLAWIATAESKGLFAKKQHTQIGGDTNASDKQVTDLNSLSPIQLFRAGYGAK
jgi:ribonucleoside-triphosphate reductase